MESWRNNRARVCAPVVESGAFTFGLEGPASPTREVGLSAEMATAEAMGALAKLAD
jgi:hypothetical protein